MKKKVIVILVLSFLVGTGLLVMEHGNADVSQVERNSKGEGNKVEEYEVKVDEWEEKIKVEVAEQEYTSEEIQQVFQEVTEKLDQVILGDNESFDRVETDLRLVKSLEGYPVQIEWELDSYKVLDLEGHIQEEDVVEEGTMVELRGTISYLEEQIIYIRSVMVYPRTLEGAELLFHEIQQAVQKAEESSRKETSFLLPEEIQGKPISWSQRKSNTGLYVMFLGVMLAVFLVYREREKKRQALENRREVLARGYPGMISKLNMLLGTGMTVKHAWEIIVRNYESQKEQMGVQLVYEEMSMTLREMQGGISEGEAYERFGKRCELTPYLKLGAMLSQNLRKGSRGISDLLRVEAIQSFENRKSMAKRKGEEAGTKLMMPMMGMLAVVMIMVMVPAFLTMQF